MILVLAASGAGAATFAVTSGDWQTIVFAIAVGLAGVAVFRTGRHKEADASLLRALEAQKAEREAIQASLDRLASTLHEKDRLIGENAGRIDALERENHQLKDLVMGKQVPDALAAMMTSLTQSALMTIQDSLRSHEGILVARINLLQEQLLRKEPNGHPEQTTG